MERLKFTLFLITLALFIISIIYNISYNIRKRRKINTCESISGNVYNDILCRKGMWYVCTDYHKSTSLNNVLITIGCKTKNIEEWDNFFSEECTIQYSTPRNTRDFENIKNDYLFLRKHLIEQLKKEIT